MIRDLNNFVKFFHSSKSISPLILRRIEGIYSQFWPVSLVDSDIKTFLSVLYLSTKYFKPRVVVQTGTFIGTSSIAIALALEENLIGRLYTIDPEPLNYFGVIEPVSIAKVASQHGGLESKICFVKGYSTISYDRNRMKFVKAPKWRLKEMASNARFDMLVVDGDHSFLGCYFDLVYGTPAFTLDGPRLIVVHDYLGIPEVNRAVNKWKAPFSNFIMKVVPSPCGIALIQMK